MSEPRLSSRRADGVAVLTLDRPDALNAIDMEMQRQLDAALTGLEEDPSVGAVILTGAGDRAFSAGYDVHEMAEWDADELLVRLLERERYIWHVAATPLPLICALGGLTYGAGAIMATAADIRIGCPSTRFRFTAVPHGGANATWSLPPLVGRGLAAELLLSSRTVNADEALRIGLLNRVVDEHELIDAASELAAQIASHPRAATRAIKRLLRDGDGTGWEQRFETENVLMRTELRPRPVSELYADQKTFTLHRREAN